MAAGIATHLIAQQTSLDDDNQTKHSETSELSEMVGTVICSAGVWASPGSPATQGAIDALTSMGIDISDHASQMLTEDLTQSADWVFCMTADHLNIVLQFQTDHPERILLLHPEGQPIADPIGQETSVYIETANQLRDLITIRLKGIQQCVS